MPRCAGSVFASSASIVSVTRRSVMRATSGASTNRGPSRVADDDAVEDVLARVVEHAVHGAELHAVAM